MNVFILDTDKAESAVDTFKDITKKFYNLSYTIEDYDTASSDFNFNAVKSLIANNIKACAVRTSNTACYINKVVTGHRNLRKKENYQEEKPNIPDFDRPSVKPTTAPTTPQTTSPPVNLYYQPQASVASGGSVAAASVVSVTYSPENTESEKKEVQKDADNSKAVKVKVQNISHEKVDKESLNSAGKFMFEHKDFAYNDAGYAKIGDRYVISCTSDYGVVGDEINIKMKDGSIVKCIIGQLNDGESSRLNFFVNNSWKEGAAGNLPVNFVGNISGISNVGFNDKYSISPAVSDTLDWAYDLAHGVASGGKYDDYNEANRFGYSSFVLSSYKSSGVKIDEKEGESIEETLKNAGFEKVEGSIDTSTLKPGDILIDENDQLKMYYGDGKYIEEYGDVTGKYSKFGVRIADYTGQSWHGVLRYSNDKASATDVVKKTSTLSYADVLDKEA